MKLFTFTVNVFCSARQRQETFWVVSQTRDSAVATVLARRESYRLLWVLCEGRKV